MSVSSKRIRRPRGRKHPTSRLGLFFRRRRRLVFTLLGAAVCVALYIYMFYSYVILPLSPRWQGIYGTPLQPDGYSIVGIDISHHQGSIDWPKVGRAKIGDYPVRFVFIKATEGRETVDPNYGSNFEAARHQGIIRGAYHYFSPSVPVKEQVDNYTNQVDLKPGDLPPVLDIETIGKLQPEELRSRALLWLRLVEAHYGVKPILYTYHKFKTNYLDTPEFADYPYWIAHYYVDTLRYEGAWRFWQHTDRGRVDGIRGHVDLNVYNGSMYELKQLTLPEPGDTLEAHQQVNP